MLADLILQLLFTISLSLITLTSCKLEESKPSTNLPIEKASTIELQTRLRENILTVGQLISDYKSNRLAGKKKYEGKKLELTGIVNSVEKSMLSEEIYVDLTSEQKNGKVTCNLGSHPSSTQENKALLLRKGQSITVKGKCYMASDWIIFTDCSIK